MRNAAFLLPTGLRRSRSFLAAATIMGSVAATLSCSVLSPQHPWDLPPPPTRDAPVIQPGALTRSTLSNGLRVVVLEDRRLPRVVLGVTLRRGAGSVPSEQSGLATFTH